MFGYFNKLRKKPKHVRDNIAFSMAGGFTLILAVVWFMTGFNPSTNQEISSGEDSAPFATLLGQIQEQMASAKDSVSENEATAEMPVDNTGEWGLSAQNASTSRQPIPEEVSIMVVPTPTTTATTSRSATSSVLY